MAAMRAIGQRLCQMVHDAGLRHGTEDHLQTVLATSWFMAIVDASYDSHAREQHGTDHAAPADESDPVHSMQL
jgi:hypothetical protein